MKPRTIFNLTPRIRRRMRRNGWLIVIPMLILAAGVVWGSFQWALSPSIRHPEQPVAVELTSTGRIFTVETDKHYLLAEHSGSDVLVQVSPEAVPDEGETFTAYATALTPESMGFQPTMPYSDADASTFTMEPHSGGLKHGATVLWVVLMMVVLTTILSVASAAAQMIFMSYTSEKTLAFEWTFPMRTVKSFYKGTSSKSDREGSSAKKDKEVTVAGWVVAALVGLSALAVTLRLAQPLQSPSFDFMAAVLSVICILIALAATAWPATFVAEKLANRLAAKAQWSPPLDMPARFLNLDDEYFEVAVPYADNWLIKWLESSGWDEETAMAVYSDYQGSVEELITFSKLNGPEA